MNPHEAYISEGGKRGSFKEQIDRDRFKEGMLQLTWFQHLCELQYKSELEMQNVLQKIIQQSPAQEKYIASATPDEKRDLIVADMVDSPIGYVEANWFRIHFPNDRSKPLEPEYKLLLDTFDVDPVGVNEKLTELFKESIIKH